MKVTPASPHPWGGVTWPLVASYKYLGVTVSSGGLFADHIASKLDKATTTANDQRKLTHNSHIPVKLRKLALNATVLRACGALGC